MSLLEVNEVTPNAKLLTGCGDGVRNEKPSTKRVVRPPVPSCRRFSTRPPPDHATTVKVQLEKAIQELAAHPNVTRRKALTMAEITPTRSVTNKKKDGLLQQQLSSSSMHDVSGSVATKTRLATSSAPPRKEDAGRRVYHLLLLNAWRRGRTQVATLTDSLGALETQNGNLELQIDALRRLRQAESDKRSEAVNENQRLQNHVEELLKGNKALIDEKNALETALQISEQKYESLRLELQNARNDWTTTRCELRNIEHQLGVERGKIKKLREEKNDCLEKLSHKEQEVVSLADQIDDLQERLLNTEINLQDTILSNNSYEDNIKGLLKKITDEIATNTNLQKKLQETAINNEKLETKVDELKNAIQNGKETAKKIEDENLKLKKELMQAKEALKREQERPWWKNAGELARAPLSALQNAAYIMLPAVPRAAVTRTTSTTDMMPTNVP